MIVGAIASCCIRGYPPIFCNDKKEAAELIVRLYYKAKDNKDRKIVKAIRPKSTHKDRVINVLINYPYVSERIAKNLIEYYGSIDAINNGLKSLFKKENKKLMRQLGLNKRSLEQSVGILIGEVKKEEGE
jgi:ERCC4-type nuclease